MHWIIQENICQEKKWNELIDNIERLDIPYSVHKLVPFSGELIPEPKLTTNKIFCYGSTSLNLTSQKNNWKPGVFPVPEYNVQMNSPWYEHYLNNNPRYWYIYQLPNAILKDDFYFIKPDNDSKFITGQIMTSSEIKEWAYRISILGENDGSNVNKDSIVILCSPKNIKKEARFWIVDDHVITFSLYKLGNTVIHNKNLVDDKMSAFAHYLCSEMGTSYWRPADAYCLDICIDNNDNPKIVEINNINNSGLYDCDTQKLVFALKTLLMR